MTEHSAAVFECGKADNEHQLFLFIIQASIFFSFTRSVSLFEINNKK